MAALFRKSSADSQGCQWEPQWSEIYPHIPKPDAPDADKTEAEEYLATVGIQCSKLAMNPTSCHGCPDNPAGKEKQDAQEHDKRLIEDHGYELQLTQRLYTASRLGLLTDWNLTEEEFQNLAVFQAEVQKRSRG